MRCGTSRGVGDAVRKPWQAAFPVALAGRRRASESLDDVPHRLRLPSYPIANHLAWAKKGRLDDPYRSLSPILGIGSEYGETQHMADIGGVAADRLRSFVERIERLEEEKQALAADIREVYGEAKGTGFDVKVLRQIIRLRKMDDGDRTEMEEILSVYRRALGF